jgi:hypothetical protein
MTRWEQKTLFSKCGEQKPFFKKPSILLIPQQQQAIKHYMFVAIASGGLVSGIHKI